MAPEQGAQRLSKGRNSIAEVKERFELLRICDLGLRINLISDWGLKALKSTKIGVAVDSQNF